MTPVPATPVAIEPLANPLPVAPPVMPHSASATSFSDLLVKSIDGVNSKITEANNLVRAFALDDSIPVHQVTYALSQAQLSLELMMQVRNRLLEGYQQLMNMQL